MTLIRLVAMYWLGVLITLALQHAQEHGTVGGTLPYRILVFTARAIHVLVTPALLLAGIWEAVAR